ncbi:MAG: putative sulfate exporter family transporter [Actinobacteria bacterium]|nr:putative sulfate exporter family transporter [Actinomycetota bacterium]
MSTTIDNAGTASSRLSFRDFIGRDGPGLLLSAAIALPAYEISRYTSSLDPLATSLILGIVLGNVLGPGAAIKPGVRFTASLFIPIGIILYGTMLHFDMLSGLPGFAIAAILLGMATFYLVILLGGRMLKVDAGTGLLIASGSAICGASAIAVLAPVAGAHSKDTSMAVIVITTVGLTGAILYPLICDFLSMSTMSYGFFCGSTLQQIGIVKLAASHLGREAGKIAVTVKMVRIAMLAPIMMILAPAVSLASGKARGAVPGVEEPRAPARSMSVMRLAARRAWFVPVFVCMAFLSSFVQPVMNAGPVLRPVATITLSLALASIGLAVDFDSIKSSGSKPLLLGFAGWAIAAGFFLFVTMPLFSLGG